VVDGGLLVVTGGLLVVTGGFLVFAADFYRVNAGLMLRLLLIYWPLWRRNARLMLLFLWGYCAPQPPLAGGGVLKADAGCFLPIVILAQLTGFNIFKERFLTYELRLNPVNFPAFPEISGSEDIVGVFQSRVVFCRAGLSGYLTFLSSFGYCETQTSVTIKIMASQCFSS